MLFFASSSSLLNNALVLRNLAVAILKHSANEIEYAHLHSASYFKIIGLTPIIS
jgi:hypothetical protein